MTIPTTTFRLGPETTRLLEALAARLEIDRTAVLRLAVRRLARAEGIESPAPSGKKGSR